jgi:hypothetical protein
LDVIRRGVGAQKVEFSPREGGKEFAVVVTYTTKEGKTVVHESLFTQARVFGESKRGSLQAWRVQKKACDYAREVMREVLEKRGVKL